MFGAKATNHAPRGFGRLLLQQRTLGVGGGPEHLDVCSQAAKGKRIPPVRFVVKSRFRTPFFALSASGWMPSAPLVPVGCLVSLGG
jgi:hypothetical protein